VMVAEIAEARAEIAVLVVVGTWAA
jgi:hypothetical protein